VIFGSDLSDDFPPLPADQEVFCNPQDLTVTCTDIAFSFHDGNGFPTTAPISGVVTSVRYRSNTADQATLRLARVDQQTEEAVGVGVGPTATLNPTGQPTEVPVNPGLPGGMRWETIDRCDGTVTKVTRGRVAVRDFRRKKTVIVRAGKSYLAKARR
jgi:hypothetical protein